MRTLIVPCAGRSSRFQDMRPKWLLTHPHGKAMIESSLKGFDFRFFDRVIFTIVREHDEKYGASRILREIFLDKKFEILILEDFTRSQAATVFETLERMKVEGAFVCKDVDNSVIFSSAIFETTQSSEFVVGLNLNEFAEVSRLKSKSFLITNNQGQIVDIIEKSIRSNQICVGVYGFSSPTLFKEAFAEIEKNKINSGEVYLSHIISYLIGLEKSVYRYVQATEYEDWGTFEDWKKILKKHSTYFVDVDGVLLVNRGKNSKPGWDDKPEPLMANVDLLKKLIQSGAQVIITSSRPESYRSMLKDLLKELGVEYHSMILGCHHAPRVLINDFAKSNPYPTSSAISIPRDGNLQEYLSCE